jgi:hypothetical protein
MNHAPSSRHTVELGAPAELRTLVHLPPQTQARALE